MARSPVSKKIRFEILKRDQFKCRYCGMSEADGAKLHVDHVIPVALGGHNNPDNLVASCADCNLGKSANLLDDPKLIGVDFEARKEVFKQAQESHERYKEYRKEREKYERGLISDMLHPMKDCVFIDAPPHKWGTPHWRFDYELPVLEQYLDVGDLPGVPSCQSRMSQALENIAHGERLVGPTVMYFFRGLGLDAVRGAAEVTANKLFQLDFDWSTIDAWRYFCAICHKRMPNYESEALA